MSDFLGGLGSEMTPKDKTLDARNWTLGGNGGSKIIKNRRTSFMDDPYLRCYAIQNSCYLVGRFRTTSTIFIDLPIFS